MNAELIVIWNGAHLGVNMDLLCVPRIPERPIDPPEHWTDEPASDTGTKHRSLAEVEADRAAVLNVLASGRVVTLAAIRQQTGIVGHRQLHIALRELMARNLVRRAGYARVRVTLKGRRAGQGQNL